MRVNKASYVSIIISLSVYLFEQKFVIPLNLASDIRNFYTRIPVRAGFVTGQLSATRRDSPDIQDGRWAQVLWLTVARGHNHALPSRMLFNAPKPDWSVNQTPKRQPTMGPVHSYGIE